jgi:hypothetical protein
MTGLLSLDLFAVIERADVAFQPARSEEPIHSKGHNTETREILLVRRPPAQHVLTFFITSTITVFPRPCHAAVPLISSWAISSALPRTTTTALVGRFFLSPLDVWRV